MCSSSSSSTTTLPEASDEEKKLQSWMMGAIESVFNEGGMVLDTKEVTKFKNEPKVEALQEQATLYDRQIQEMKTEIARVHKAGGAVTEMQQKLQVLERQAVDVRNNLANEMNNSETTYETELVDVRVDDLRKQGKTEEAAALESQLRQEAGADKSRKEKIARQIMDVAEKYLRGDLSITPEQEAELKASTERIREPVSKLLTDLKSQIDETTADVEGVLDQESDQITKTFKSTSEALESLRRQIKDTGLNVDNALMEAFARAEQTGSDMLKGLAETVQTSRDLSEQGLFKQTKELRSNLSMLAASTGRSQFDPAFVRVLQNKTLESVKDVELSLANMEATGKLGILESTGNRLTDIQLLRAGNIRETGQALEGVGTAEAQLAENTGLRREDLFRTRAQLREGAGQRKESVAQLRAGLEEQLLRDQENRRMALAQGLPVSQIQAGTAAIAGANQNFATNIGGIQSGLAGVSDSLGQLRNIRAAQPTTTTTSTPSVLGTIAGTIGSLAGGAGDLFKGIGALRG